MASVLPDGLDPAFSGRQSYCNPSETEKEHRVGWDLQIEIRCAMDQDCEKGAGARK